MRVAIVMVLCVLHAAGGSSISVARKLLQEFEIATPVAGVSIAESEVSTPVVSDGTSDFSSVEGGVQQLAEESPTDPSSNSETDQNTSPATSGSQSAPDTTTPETFGMGDAQEVVEGGENGFMETTTQLETTGGQTGENPDDSQQEGENVATDAAPTDQEASGAEQQSDLAEANPSENGSPDNVEDEAVRSGGEETTTEESTGENSPDGPGDADVEPNPGSDTAPSVPVAEPTAESAGSDDNGQASAPLGEPSENASTEEEEESEQGVAGCDPFDLWNAVEDGKIDKVKALASSCPDILEAQSKLEVDGEQWGTVLHASVIFEHLDIVRVLLDAGSDVNGATTNGWTALHLAAAFGLPEIARELLDRGADKNALDSSQQIPLHDACSGGYVEVAQLLVKWGSNVNQGNEFGETPLIVSAIKNKPEIIKILLEGGADIDLKDNEGQTALIEAAIYGARVGKM
ncbi:hypothetical protein BSKO_01116 [Bryopsis sp. KO-2023]|nr:hypothetical protein BSKO_01116 [Bryopsis sp. KO-2023]